MPEVIYEAAKAFPQGKSLGRSVLVGYAFFAVGGPIVALLGGRTSLVEIVVIPLLLGTLLALVLVLYGLQGVRVTPSEVRLRGWLGSRTIERRQIAEGVHIRDFAIMGRSSGYVALLDHRGRALWRSSADQWSPEAVQVLVGTGRWRSVVGRMTPAQVRRWRPGLLPWHLVHQALTVLLAMVTGFVLVGVMLGVAAALR